MARDALTRQFLTNALGQFDQVTVGGRQSPELLAQFAEARPRTGTDLLFRWTQRARAAVKPTAAQPGRIALIGELFRFRAIVEGFAQSGSLATRAQDVDVDVLIMSEDDVPHAERMQKVLAEAGASAAVVDLRDRDFEALVFLFACYSSVVTTRFHGLVTAALAGVPVLALDVADGKSARLRAASVQPKHSQSTATRTRRAGSRQRSRAPS